MELLLKGVSVPARFRFPKPMNDRELLRFCANNRDLRIEQEPDGEILVLAPGSALSGLIEAEIGLQLNLWARGNGRGRTFGAGVGFRLPDGSVRAGSAVWIGCDRWNEISGIEQDGYVHACPEFVIEIRSKSDRLPRLTSKMKAWIANGAELGWLIDHELGRVTIYRPHELPEIHRGLNLVRGTGPVSGFEFRYSEDF